MSRARRPAASKGARDKAPPSADIGGLVAIYGHDEVGGPARLRRGQNAIARAKLQRFLGNDEEAEALARRSLVDFAGAMNWLEDTPEFEIAHHHLDEAGRWVRQRFGCWLDRDGVTYSRTCSADLAHIRMGLSPGMRNVIRVCSVCGLDPRLCRHVTGKVYMGSRRIVGDRCNLCGQVTCDHQDGESGPVTCSHLITQVGNLDEVSIVPRPAQPMARIGRIRVPVDDLAEQLGPRGWLPGMEVSCDKCLTFCRGVREMPDSKSDLPDGAGGVAP